MAKVLLVEDVIETRDLIEDILDRMGHVTDVAGDGEDAEIYFESHEYDLIITDLMMPNKNGFEFMKKIRSVNTDVGVIAISGGGQFINSKLTTSLAQIYSNRIIKKPFSKAEISAAVNSVLKESGVSSA